MAQSGRPWRPRKRRRKGPRGEAKPASTLIDELLGRHGAARELREHRLLTHWPEVVGDRVAARSTPDGLARGVLWVRVSNSAWLHELSFLRDDLVKRANQLCGAPPLIRELRFHLGPRDRPSTDDSLAPTTRIRRAPPVQRALPPPAAGEHLTRIERETEDIEDPELRDIIRTARTRLDL